MCFVRVPSWDVGGRDKDSKHAKIRLGNANAIAQGKEGLTHGVASCTQFGNGLLNCEM